jgi:hypothetical protein
MPAEPNDWFPAKRYGWGWGLPCAWQGWATFMGFIALLALGAVVVSPSQNMPAFLAWTGALTLLLLAICRLKGEPPNWRRGGQ